MIDPVSAWAFGVIAGGAVGFWIGRWWPHTARSMGPPRGSYGPRRPEQPLAADLIRYSRWRSEQIERALRDEPPTPN